jgi:hypothetical protein
VQVDGEPVSLSPDELIVTQTPRTGWAVATDAGETVALEVTITPELRREGYAREVVRLVQEARKADGLRVSDRIRLRWAAVDPELAEALTEHGELIGAEVLATDYAQRAAPGGVAGGQLPVPNEEAAERVDPDAARRAERDLGSPDAGEPGAGDADAGEPDAGWRKHAEPALGLTFWLARAESP